MKTIKHIRLFAIAAIMLLGQFPLVNISSAVEIQQFTTPKGIKVYLVENYTSPLITVSFSFAAGAAQDPKGKEGVSRLLAAMLDEGSGEMSSEEFQAKAEELGADISYNAGRDNFTGSIQMLARYSQESFELLRISVNEPRFDKQPIERMRQAILLGLERAKNNPQSIAAKALRAAVFGQHPYARSNKGNIEAIAAITRDDLVAMHKNLFVRQGMVIGVVGAIASDELAEKIDMVFAPLPQKSEQPTIAEAQPKFGETIRKHMDIPQSIISMALPGLKRSDPEFFAAYIANHILGGGTFSSRLYEEVREKRGLAYSVYAHLATYTHGAFTIVGSATSNERVEDAIRVIRNEIKKMAQDGPTPAELEAARKYIIGSYAIRNLDTSIKVAGVLVAIQQINLGIDYIDRREEIINAVTLDDVKKVAARLLSVEPTLVIVGPENSEG